FNVGSTNGLDFSFKTYSVDTDLRMLMRDISIATNNLEGLLNSELTVTSANTGNWGSWQGNGKVNLRDGLIWDIPMFGILSPALNMFWPGLGNSRADQGAATFVITNSVIETKDLEIHTSAMRLHYDGTVDFKAAVNATAEAELLKDAWVIGPFISLAFTPLTKLFE